MNTKTLKDTNLVRLTITLMAVIISIFSDANAENTVSPIIKIGFGKPTYMQNLYYKKMYAKKSYHNAILFYYDNGLYKII